MRHAPALHVLTAALIVVLAGCASPSTTRADGAPVAVAPASQLPSRAYGIQEFIDTVGVAGASFSADESKLLFSSNKTGVWNTYSMPVGGGDWTPITTSTTDNHYAVAYFPDDDRVLVTRDQGGNELNHLYVIGTDGNERDLTPGAKLRAQFAGFSRDGKSFFVSSNERDPRYFDLYRYDSKTYARTRIFENTTGYQPGEISADRRWLALNQINTTNDADLFVANLATGKVTKVSEHTGEAQFSAADFSPDGQWLYYIANDAGEFAELRRVNLSNWRHEPVQTSEWDITDSYFSHNGRYRVTVINADGSTKLEVVEAASGKPVALPRLPAGDVRNVRISRSENRMAFYINGDRQPSDLYVVDFGGEAKQLTRSLNPAINPADLVDSSVVRFQSFDGMSIPNILWKPHQATAGRKAPALVWVHGGPGGQTTRAHS
ncbi:MAG: S9 family peptidase, partial [Pseudomonadota bacterium]